jgi:hypothetical protein
VADTVTLKLAHPLKAEHAERLHAKDAKDYWIGDQITVPRADAIFIIQAGYAAGVDPADHDAVHKALEGRSGTTSTKAK